MRAKVTKIGEQQESKHGGKYIPIFFKSMEDGKSYRTWLSLACRNFSAWSFVLQPGYDLNTTLDGLRVKENDLLDADFPPIIYRPAIPAQEELPGNPGKQEEIFNNYDMAKKHLAEARKILAKGREKCPNQ